MDQVDVEEAWVVEEEDEEWVEEVAHLQGVLNIDVWCQVSTECCLIS